MEKPKTKNERYYLSTGRYKTETERKIKPWGKEIKITNKRKTLTGY